MANDNSIKFEKILSTARLRPTTRPGRNILTESESDRGRVLFSPAFRRLQQKAQVFSMEPNAAVRSRLTHSLEVSQIGRFLSDEICQRLIEASSTRLTEIQRAALVNFVETACLMHDIGNPPFGHFGEAAIQEWFKLHGEACLLEAIGHTASASDHSAINVALADFREFDGNPQGLRIVARLQWNTDSFGMNLTATALATFLKYSRSPLEQKSKGPFTKKAGYFSTEQKYIQFIKDVFEYSSLRRFPLAYIMEAADDIAYCISDLEDSLEKSIIHKNLALPEIESRYQQKKFADDAAGHAEILAALQSIRSGKRNERDFTFTDFRTSVNNAIVHYAADRFVQNEAHVENGTLETLLPEDEPPGFLLKVLKDFCRERVYTHVSVQRVELAGYNAIYGLLEQFRPLLKASRSRFDACRQGKREDDKKARILLEPKLLKLFPEKYLKAYEHYVAEFSDSEAPEIVEWNARAHLITDFISGMTDDFAMTTYRTLVGIEL